MTATAPDAGKKMTFWEHLDELRSRLLRALVAYFVGVGVAWAYRDPILAWLWKPFADSWRAQHIPGDPALNFASPGDAFVSYMKLSLLAGLLFAAPVIFWQIWAFVAPGLYAKEKRFVLPFVAASTTLFVGGGLFGWRVAFPITFDYFLQLAGTAREAGVAVQPVVMIGDYLDFVAQMLLAFGLVFELPLFILFLAIAGIVNWLQLWRFGRWFVLIAFTVGAVVTPPDTASQIAMSVPLCALYFVSVGLAWLFGKRPSREEIEEDRRRREERKREKREARAAAAKEKAGKRGG